MSRIEPATGQVFGRKSEQCPKPDPDAHDSIPDLDDNADAADERNRFRGTCYRAANRLRVGETKGRGKLYRRHRGLSTVRHIYLYPLRKDFRQKLRST